ncbi:MAG TPA: methyl-accepting chemotaxis protein [candidate division Zixibacteria bacterium]|nr:methyl-accepting chemotaxis protein [candidate division Zixibacteria bacterium]
MKLSIKWNIRNQILGTGLISLLVIVAVITYFYNFSKSAFQQNSQNLIQVSNGQFADELDRILTNRSEVFTFWTRDDMFGIALEFNSTTEVAAQFERWMAGTSGFSLVALIDKSARVVEIAGSPLIKVDASALKGKILTDFKDIANVENPAVNLIRSQTMEQLGLSNSYTYAYCYPSHSSSGEVNGGFVAFLDFDEIDQAVAKCSSVLAGFGYDDSHSILICPSRDLVLSGKANPNWNLAAEDKSTWTQLKQAIRSASDDQVIIRPVNGENTYLGVSFVHSPKAEGLLGNTQETPILLTIVPEKQVLAHLNSQLIAVLLVGLFGTLVVMALSYFVSQRISRRVSRVAEIATKMAEGDVEQHLEVRGNDEITTLAIAFSKLSDYMKNLSFVAKSIAEGDLTARLQPRSSKDTLGQSVKTMLDNLTHIIRQLSDSSRELTSAASTISATSGRIAEGVQDQAQRVQEVSTAIEEMTATIFESSKNASVATDASRNAANTATDGGRVVHSAIAGMQTISDVVRMSAQSITDLARSADQIGEITRVIDDIADQTNLLALNAAIEAARAGEQGRGFAVVADEVRKLAERTGKATAEISQMIKGIQRQTEEAVESMESGVQEVDKGRELVDRAGNSLNDIVTMSQQVMDMIQQIATAAEQQSSAAEEVTRSVEQISTVTTDTARGSEQSAQAAEELNRQANGLQRIVDQFRFDTDQITMFQAAQRDHVLYMDRLQHIIERTIDPQAWTPCDHTQCRFGKWYYGSGQTKCRHLEEFRKIETPHAQVHHHADKAVEYMKSGQQDRAHEEFRKAFEASQTLSSLLEQANRVAQEDLV